MIPATCFHCKFAYIDEGDSSVGLSSSAGCEDEEMFKEIEEDYKKFLEEITHFEALRGIHKILTANGQSHYFNPEDFATICPKFQSKEEICLICGKPIEHKWNGWINRLCCVTGWDEDIVCSRECEKYGQMWIDLCEDEFIKEEMKNKEQL